MSPLSRFAVLIAVGFAGANGAAAQISIPLTAVSAAYPGIDPVTLTLNGMTQNARPTPFVISGLDAGLNGTWFCLDPLQPMYYSGSGEPAGNSLVFDSTNPANFDLWGAPAPGLTPARLQNLADLFQAYLPAGTPTSLLAGALQLAVWEIANESSAFAFSLSGPGYLSVTPVSGAFTSADMVTLASAMLASLGDVGINNRGSAAGVNLLIDGTYQRDATTNVLVQDLVGFSVTPVPEPGTYALGAVAVLLVGVVVQRSRQKRLSVQPSR